MTRNNTANNAQTKLTASIAAGDTSFYVNDGSVLPTAPFVVSIENEIMLVGAKVGNLLSNVTRGYESTTAAVHEAEIVVENRWTAGDRDAIYAELDAHTAAKSHIGLNPSCRVYHSATQTLADSTVVALAFDSERWDNASMHSTSTNNSRIIAPESGYYLVFGHVNWGTSTAGDRQLYHRVDGTIVVNATRTAAGSTGVCQSSVSSVIYLAQNSYVELVARQTSGGNLDITSNAQFSPEFGMVRVA